MATLPNHSDIQGAMPPDQLALANAAAARRSPPKGGNLIKEPKDNIYGRFKLLQRIDGLYVVHDPEQWPPNGPVFRSEDEARDHAKARAAEEAARVIPRPAP